MSVFNITLFPDPVEPAISRCGIVSSGDTLMRPLASFPSGIVSRDADLVNSSDSRICRRLISSRRVFGTSMPTVGFPGMRSMMIDSACSPRQRSSVSPVMRLYLMPASGLNSNVVTTGPGLIWTTEPNTLNSSNFDLIRAAVCFSSSSSKALRTGASLSKEEGGRTYCFLGGAKGLPTTRSPVGSGSGRTGSTNIGVTGLSGSRSSIVRMGISSGSAGAGGSSSQGGASAPTSSGRGAAAGSSTGAGSMTGARSRTRFVTGRASRRFARARHHCPTGRSTRLGTLTANDRCESRKPEDR